MLSTIWGLIFTISLKWSSNSTYVTVCSVFSCYFYPSVSLLDTFIALQFLYSVTLMELELWVLVLRSFIDFICYLAVLWTEFCLFLCLLLIFSWTLEARSLTTFEIRIWVKYIHHSTDLLSNFDLSSPGEKLKLIPKYLNAKDLLLGFLRFIVK